jgi:hypothetical protein
MIAWNSAQIAGTASGSSTTCMRAQGSVHEVVERQDREHGLERPGCAHAIDSHHAPAHGRGREVGVDDHQPVAGPHGAEHVEQGGIEQRVQALPARGDACLSRKGGAPTCVRLPVRATTLLRRQT